LAVNFQWLPPQSLLDSGDLEPLLPVEWMSIATPTMVGSPDIHVMGIMLGEGIE